MAEKDLLIKEKVESSGLFDFPGLYSFAHSWLREEGFGVTEEKYSEKISGNEREIDIEWKAIKGLSDYFREEIAIKFEIKGLSDVEVEVDGKKKKMKKGKVTVELKGALVTDPSSKWDAQPLTKFLKDFYNKYIVPARIESLQFKVRGDTTDFKERLKAYLDLAGRR